VIAMMPSDLGVQRNVFSMCSRFMPHASTNGFVCAFRPPAMATTGCPQARRRARSVVRHSQSPPKSCPNTTQHDALGPPRQLVAHRLLHTRGRCCSVRARRRQSEREWCVSRWPGFTRLHCSHLPTLQGKRKSSKPPPKKVQPKLAKQFTCPFCNNEKTVTAKLCVPPPPGGAGGTPCAPPAHARAAVVQGL